MLLVRVALILLALALPALAQEDPTSPAGQGAPAAGSGAAESICLIVESAARAAGLPLEFFARVIWQESRFRADAIGPRTRGGQHAQGIAQFMP